MSETETPVEEELEQTEEPEGEPEKEDVPKTRAEERLAALDAIVPPDRQVEQEPEEPEESPEKTEAEPEKEDEPEMVTVKVYGEERQVTQQEVDEAGGVEAY